MRQVVINVGRRSCVAVVLLGAFVSVAAPATAQDQAELERHDLEARTRFEAGRLAFEAGRFEDALADFRRAYELSGRADLLYNIGQAADRLRLDTEALEAFQRFLDGVGPGLAIRAEVEARVRVLRAATEDERAQATDAPEQYSGDSVVSDVTRPPPQPGAVAADISPWIALGAGGVVAVAGAVLLGVGLSDRAAVEGAPDGASWSAFRDAADRGPILEAAGSASLVVGFG